MSENLVNLFRTQLASSAQAFIWAVEQLPEERRLTCPPHGKEEWSAARSAFHLLAYERRLALPSMRLWLGEAFTYDIDYDEDKEWASGHDLTVTLQQFSQIRDEQSALLALYPDEAWETALFTPAWEEQTLRWVLTKTLQHTFEHTHDVLRMGLFWDFPLETTTNEA